MTSLFKGTANSEQLFILTYAELDKHQIVNKISRDETWYRERHEGWTYILNKLINSFNVEGMKYPICVMFKDDSYNCCHGGQRLAAAMKSNLTTVPCIIAWRNYDIDKIPADSHFISDLRELDYLNHGDIERVHLSGGGFEILVKDRKHWDPNDYMDKTT